MDKLSPQTLSIRTAQPDDVIHLLRIQLDALRALCIHDYTPEQIEALVGRNIRYSSLGGSRREITLVAEVDGVRVGLCSLLGSRITALYVHPQFARRGIGTQLLNAVERMALTRQIKILRVAASLTARPFYQANGYRVGSESYLVADRGLWIPYINMKKYLLTALNFMKL